MHSLKYTNKLFDKRVLVFGGTSGVGFCVAEAALEYGARVTISGSNSEKLAKALDRLKSSYPDKAQMVSGKTCDLSLLDKQEANVDNLLRFATSEGPLDHISFSAGDVFKILPLSEVTPTWVQKSETIRFYGPLTIAKLAPKYLRQSASSSLTFTSGTAGDKPPADWAVVASRVGALEALMRGLAIDLKPVRVNVVQLGAVQTELFDSLFNSMGLSTEQREAFLVKYTEGTLVGRLGIPEDAAEAYLYCMKDHFITGSVIKTNGGKLLT